MEPPVKRRRLFRSSEPDVDLQERRARNDSRLKSRFESIFDKYGRDFEGIGDEIDMRTGEIVVNNGHILGMTDERDAGYAEISSMELEGGYYSGEEWTSDTIVDPLEQQRLASKPEGLGDGDLESELEALWRSVDDADSLMGEIEMEDPPVETDIGSRFETIVTEVEEDELASSEYEWMTPRTIRAFAQDRWRLRKQEFDPIDESTVEPAWRAPPLLKTTSSGLTAKEIAPASFDNTPQDSDSKGHEVSIWAPEEKRCRRHRTMTADIPKHLSASVSQGESSEEETLSDSSSFEHTFRPLRWTKEEEDLLCCLKATTTLKWKDMRPYFPHRKGHSILLHWSYMKNRRKVCTKLESAAQSQNALLSLSASTTPLSTRASDSKQQPYPEVSHGSDNAEKVALISKSMDAGLKDRIVNADKPVEELSEECLLQPDRNTPDAKAQCNVNPKPGQRPLEEIPLQSYAALSVAMMQEAHQVTNPIKLDPPTRDPKSGSARSAIESQKKTLHSIESEKRIPLEAAAAVHACDNGFETVGENKTQNDRKRIVLPIDPTIREEDAAIRRKNCVQTIIERGFDVVCQAADRDCNKHQCNALKDEHLCSPETEHSQANASCNTQSSNTGMLEATPSPQNSAPDLTTARHQAKGQIADLREQSTFPSGVPFVACPDTDVSSKQQVQTILTPSTSTNAVQVVIPAATCYKSSTGLTYTVDVKVRKLKPHYQRKYENSNKDLGKETHVRSPSQVVSSPEVQIHSGVSKSKLTIDAAVPGYARSDGEQSDTEDPLSSRIFASQPKGKITPISPSPRPPGTRAANFDPRITKRSNKVDPLSQKLKKHGKKLLKTTIADSFSSVSEAILDCSEDELSLL